MDNTIGCNAVGNSNSVEAVNLDSDEASVPRHIDAKGLVVQERR